MSIKTSKSYCNDLSLSTLLLFKSKIAFLICFSSLGKLNINSISRQLDINSRLSEILLRAFKIFSLYSFIIAFTPQKFKNGVV